MLKFFAEKMWVAFVVQKLLTFFQQKNIRIMYIESAKTVNEMTLNDVVKLMMLWTTGPWSLNMAYMLIFLLKKMRVAFANEIDIILARIVNILTTNELVKLTTLWTTGPSNIRIGTRYRSYWLKRHEYNVRADNYVNIVFLSSEKKDSKFSSFKINPFYRRGVWKGIHFKRKEFAPAKEHSLSF